MHSRRDFGKLLAAGLPLAAAIAEPSQGVRIGVQTYSFRDFSADTYADEVIKTMSGLGLKECELQFPRPGIGGRAAQQMDEAARKAAAEQARKQKLAVPISFYTGVGRKFKDAGIQIFAFNATFGPTDEDLEYDFQAANALGAEILASSTTISTARRVVPFAEKHKKVVAFHNHANLKDPEQFATPQSFAAMLEMSKYYRTNLDIGHFTAANFDSVAYVAEHHARISHLHLKDRKRDQGPNTVWGEGDTPIKEVIRLLKDKKDPMRAYIEYEYPGKASSPDEVKKCLGYVHTALAG